MPILNVDTSALVDRPEVADEVLQPLVDAIYAEEALYPSLWPNDTSRWVFWDTPLTVLDPDTIPPEPCFGPGATPEEIGVGYDAWSGTLVRFWGSDQVDSLTMYGQDFDLPGKPFTIWGHWTDDGGASGLFGQSAGSPQMKVLFC